MNLRLVYRAVTGEFDRALRDIHRPIAIAATGAIRDAAVQVKTEGRAAIRAAGFSAKWQNALRVNVYPTRGISADAAAFAYHEIPYAGVFERGATIRGRPLLWVPISGLPARIGGRRMTPRNFVAAIGPLHSVNRPGRPPMLVAPMSGRTGSRITLAKLRAGARAGGRTSRLVFVGLQAVSLRARFDLQPVFEKARAGLGAGYLRHLDPEA